MTRISRSGTMLALAAVPAISVGSVAAAVAKTTTKAKALSVTCKATLNQQIDADGVPVVIAADQGAQYGSIKCAHGLSRGVMADTFKTDDAGDLAGAYTQYFGDGSVHGKFTLAQEDNGVPTPGTFSSSSYAGKVTLTGGTGVYKGLTGKGTMKCTTADSLHILCTEKLKLA